MQIIKSLLKNKKKYADDTLLKIKNMSLRWHYPNQVYGRNSLISSQPFGSRVVFIYKQYRLFFLKSKGYFEVNFKMRAKNILFML